MSSAQQALEVILLKAVQAQSLEELREAVIESVKSAGPISPEAGLLLASMRPSQVDRFADLFRRYAAKRAKEPHTLGAPRALSKVEALLLVALERNGYRVEVEKGQSRWHGDALCRMNVQDGATVHSAQSREDALWALWASVSGQDGGAVSLAEEHLTGSVRRANIRKFLKKVDEEAA